MNDRKTALQRSPLTLDDVDYTLFKEKWKIIFCAAAVLVVGLVFLVVSRPS